LIIFVQKYDKMKYEQRKRAILSELDAHEILDVLEIADKLDVSSITIRRDLDKLSAEGLLDRTHGGATKIANSPLITFNAKSIQNAEAKRRICLLAANEIKDGDTLFIDCGSTTFGLCEFIKDKNITVITNSIPVFNALISSQIKLNLIGGTYDRKRLAMHGTMAVEHIKKYQVDKAYFGVDGLTANQGLTSNTENESTTTKAMIENSAESILLCDDIKIGKPAYFSFACLTEIDTIFTNSMTKHLLLIQKTYPHLKISTT
jgi:DeoR family transcriptional regulator, fructose operon transcriptional repressor